LPWKKRLNKLTDKTYEAFSTCTGTFEKVRELKSKMLHGIYSIAVRPMITYATTMWWSWIKFKTSTARHSKLQSVACWGITVAKMMTPTAATEALLELPELHLVRG
jgi:hypothetical protein